jgi:hypothetical protein
LLHQVVHTIPFHVVRIGTALFFRSKRLSAGSDETLLDKPAQERVKDTDIVGVHIIAGLIAARPIHDQAITRSAPATLGGVPDHA